jgi:mannose-6-phosphate isomerase-like protein (cupin superfamily)
VTAPEPVSKANAAHYSWGDRCDGWRLLDQVGLSVIHERMPAGKSEVRHRHHVAQQFFFILSGCAVIEVGGMERHLGSGEGLHVAAGTPHCFRNGGEGDIEFLVISQPPTSGDRENLDA